MIVAAEQILAAINDEGDAFDQTVDAQIPTRCVVLARSDEGPYAVGPIPAEKVDRVHELIVARGDEVFDVVQCLTLSALQYQHRPPRVRELKGCPSEAAYRRHLANGEPVDDECREYMRRASAAWSRREPLSGRRRTA